MEPNMNSSRQVEPECHLAVRPMRDDDAEQVLHIYRQGIETGHATFAADVPTWADWDAGHERDARLVAEMDGKVVGWVALSPTSARSVYRGVGEISVYIGRAARGRGVGHGLMSAAVIAAEAAGFWTLQAGIFPENEASVSLHARHGFETVGRRRRLGRMEHGPLKGQWRDVLLMERRSKSVGIE